MIFYYLIKPWFGFKFIILKNLDDNVLDSVSTFKFFILSIYVP